MSERILEACATVRSGVQALFKYEAISRETELKTGTFTFPSVPCAHSARSERPTGCGLSAQ
jgi:hypothetical protein